MTKEKKIILFNIIFAVIVVAFDVIYAIFSNPWVFKTTTSMLFVAGGVVNLIIAYRSGFADNKYKKFAYLMMIGLIFAMLGDILLIPKELFIVGAGLFAVGHVFFYIAYLQLSKFSWRDIICSAIIFTASLLVILLYKGFTFEGIMQIVVIIYALIISLMLGKALSNLFVKDMPTLSKWIIFIGSLMFFLSDLFLLFYMFGGKLIVFDNLCLGFYYPAEVLLATSIYYASRGERR